MNGGPPPGIGLTDQQRLDWLRLIRCDNVGPRTFRMLVNKFGGARAALEALPELASKAARPIRIVPVADVEREMEASAKIGIRFIGMGEPDYPAALRAIDACPPMIAVRGNLAILARPMVALVGSRNASAAGLAFAERLARGVAQAGHAVVSGLARGIDARAHRSTLRTGTVAVLAGGHARIYPSEHLDLLDEILETGAVITEMPLEWEPRGRDFPRRNRIVSGLSLAVVVVEAARQSGSLITARFATEQGREVFAVPGSPLDPRSEGTNDLLRQGATICTCVEDIVSALAPMMAKDLREPDLFREDGVADDRSEPLWDEFDLFGDNILPTPQTLPRMEMDEAEIAPLHGPRAGPAATPSGPQDAQNRIIALLGPSPVGIDDLARAASMPMAQVRNVLLDLELAGRLERHGGTLVSLLALPGDRLA